MQKTIRIQHSPELDDNDQSMGHKGPACGILHGLHTVGHVTLGPGVTPQACPRGSVGTTNR